MHLIMTPSKAATQKKLPKTELWEIFTAFTLICSLIFAIFLLYKDEIITGFSASNFDWYRKMSQNIFIKCDGYYCESILIPFLAYIGNFNENFIQYTKFNLALNYFSICYFALFTYIKLSRKLAILAISYTVLSLHLKIGFLEPNFPDIIFIVVAISSYIAIKSSSQASIPLVICSYLLHPTLAILVFGTTLFIYLSNSKSKEDRAAMVRILLYSIIGFFTVKIYMFLINSGTSESRASFLIDNMKHIIDHSALMSVPMVSTVNTLPLIGIFFYFIYTGRRRAIIYTFTVALLGLTFQFFALDPVRIFRCYFIPVSTIILIYATHSYK